jgi:DNA-binding NtrC family response regulator
MKRNYDIIKLLKGRKAADLQFSGILIVDDDAGLCDNLKDILEGEGYTVLCAGTSAEAARITRDLKPGLALVDLKLPDKPGTALLSDFKLSNPDCVCILMTAYADVDSAVVALEKGAFYYLQKPVRPAELLELVELAFETIRLKAEKRQAEDALLARNKELEEIVERLKKMINGSSE